jgi:hypothetical protein
MSDTKHSFEWLTQQFEMLTDRMEKAKDKNERKEILRRMRVILDEVDELMAKGDLQKSASKEKAPNFGLPAEVEGTD